MSKPELPKRFFKSITLRDEPGGIAVLLDGRPVRTPGRRPLAVPSQAVAEEVAAEWERQGEVIDPRTMPMTRLVNTVIEAIVDDPAPVREDVARFVESDLLFYRASGPERLVERQRQLWDPVLDWARDSFGARFVLAEGVMYVPQPEASLNAFRDRLAADEDPFRVAALHQATTLTGSALLALALAEGRLAVDEVWALAHVDEDWNIEQWGADEEAMERRAARFDEMRVAAVILAGA